MCVVSGCEKQAQKNKDGMCMSHYSFFMGDGVTCTWRRLDDGYMLVRMPSAEWRPEHRIVMEEQIGRPLYANENVHHVNGVRHDNRPVNLELWVVSQPSGQRADDLADWAELILSRYRPESLR